MGGNRSNEWGFVNVYPWQNHIELAFVVANCVVLVGTLCIGIAANLFVAWAVYRQKSLRTPNNALLVNLAVIDFLRCATDCPILLVIILGGHSGGENWAVVCDAQVVSFSLSCFVQLLTLAWISVERYQAIAHPFETAERRRRVMVWIPLTWAVSILTSALCVMFTKDSPVFVKCRRLDPETLTAYDTFGLYVLLPVWTTCFVVIVAFYTRIFILVKSHSRKIFDKGTFLNQKETEKIENNDEEENTKVEIQPQTTEKPGDHMLSTANVPPAIGSLPRGEQNAPVVESAALPDPTKQTSIGNPSKPSDSGQTGLSASLTKSHNVSFQPQPQADAVRLIDLEGVVGDGPLAAGASAAVAPAPAKETQVSGSPAENNADQEEMAGAVCMMPSFANKERGNKTKEGKLAKRSGYIILTFLILWLPLVMTVLLNFLAGMDQEPIMVLLRELEILAVSLACMTSVTNPITYAVVNHQFRAEFYNLRNKCRALWRKS